MKTIKQLNQEAGEAFAFAWLQGSEQIIKRGGSPLPLTRFSRDDARLQIPEHFYEAAAKENKRWWLSGRNWQRVAAAAEISAKMTLKYIGAERYPLTLAHFTRKAAVVKIQVSSDKLDLARAGGSEYADKFAGASLDAVVKDDGWAYTDNAKFPPGLFTADSGKAVAA